jgi:pimeloyl-ACP methyl ester carboxylesterase
LRHAKRWRTLLVAVSLIGLLSTSLKLYSDQAIRRAETAYPPIGQFVTTEGVAMHYLERGSGPPIVLIHGSDGVLQDFVMAGLVDRLAADYRVFAFDRPGHGYSGRPLDEPLTVGLNARLIHGAIKALGIEKPIVVGHSYGGAVALQYAVDYPDDAAGLLLLAPGAFSQSPDLPPLMVPALNRDAFYPEPTPPAAYLELMRNLGVRPKQFTAYTQEWKAHHQSMTALAQRYGEIRLPVTVIAGAEDRLTPLDDHARPLQRAIPGATLTVLPNTGHEVHDQHPEAVVEAIHSLARAAWPESGGSWRR